MTRCLPQQRIPSKLCKLRTEHKECVDAVLLLKPTSSNTIIGDCVEVDFYPHLVQAYLINKHAVRVTVRYAGDGKYRIWRKG